MPRRRPHFSLVDVLDFFPEKVRSPAVVVLGRAGEVAEFIANREVSDDVCYQMDAYEAEQLGKRLDEEEAAAQICVEADLWDVPGPFQTVLYPAAEGGERSLKIDMVEQAYHVLDKHGAFIVVTPYQNDQLFPSLLKKIFGKVHIPAAGDGFLFWCQRGGDRPRRRHELTYHVQRPDGPSLHFVSRPGVFSYGRFDNGGRALTESMHIEPGDRILDIGCGCGTNGIIAGLQAGPEGQVVFVDTNVRALALSRLNADANGLTNYKTVASTDIEGVGGTDFDVASANPPYFAQHHIAKLFIRRSGKLLRPGGRFYLVTRQPNEIGPLVADVFEEAEVEFRRGYAIFSATR